MKICKLIQKSVLFEKNRVCLYFIAGVVAVPEEENIEPNCTIRSTCFILILPHSLQLTKDLKYILWGFEANLAH